MWQREKMAQSRYVERGWLRSKAKKPRYRGCGKPSSGQGIENVTWATRGHWKAKGDRDREARDRKIVAAVLKNPTVANVAEIQGHIDGYRAAAIHMGISVEATLDRLLPGWRKIEKLTAKGKR